MDIFVYSREKLNEALGSIEDNIDDLLDGKGEVTGGEEGAKGWNIDIEVFETRKLETIIIDLLKFLKKTKVPQDTHPNIQGKIAKAYE